jgi:hypothetical protein
MFLAALDGRDGKPVWASSFGRGTYEAGWDIVVEGDRLFVVGSKTGNGLDLGGGPLPPGNGFVASFNIISGAHVWSRGLTATAKSVALAADAVYVGGAGFVARLSR